MVASHCNLVVSVHLRMHCTLLIRMLITPIWDTKSSQFTHCIKCNYQPPLADFLQCHSSHIIKHFARRKKTTKPWPLQDWFTSTAASQDLQHLSLIVKLYCTKDKGIAVLVHSPRWEPQPTQAYQTPLLLKNWKWNNNTEDYSIYLASITITSTPQEAF